MDYMLQFPFYPYLLVPNDQLRGGGEHGDSIDFVQESGSREGERQEVSTRQLEKSFGDDSAVAVQRAMSVLGALGSATDV